MHRALLTVFRMPQPAHGAGGVVPEGAHVHGYDAPPNGQLDGGCGERLHDDRNRVWRREL